MSWLQGPTFPPSLMQNAAAMQEDPAADCWGLQKPKQLWILRHSNEISTTWTSGRSWKKGLLVSPAEREGEPLSLHEFNRYTAVFMLSLCDGGDFPLEWFWKLPVKKKNLKREEKYVRGRALSRFWSFWSPSLMLKGIAHSWHHQCVWPGWPGQDTAANLCLWGGFCCRWLHGKFISGDWTYSLLSCSAINQGEHLNSLKNCKHFCEGGRLSEVLGTCCAEIIFWAETFLENQTTLWGTWMGALVIWPRHFFCLWVCFLVFGFFPQIFYSFRVGGWFL